MRPFRRAGFAMLACLVVFACLAATPVLPAQKLEDVVGIYRTSPGLIHPLILEQIERHGTPLKDLQLVLHPSVPAKVQLTKGKRESLYLLEGEPALKTKQFVVPGLLNLTFRYEGGAKRAQRFEIFAGQDRQLKALSHSCVELKVAGYDAVFLDRNHDGAFGGAHDGYVVKPRRQRQWARPGEEITFHSMATPALIGANSVYFHLDPDGLEAVVATAPPDFTVERRRDYRDALALLNQLRRSLGHDPVELDESLTAGCEQHCLYCWLLGLTHDQEAGRAGSTPAGARAGKHSELIPARSMSAAVTAFSHTLYHRIRMLHPKLDKVGMGLIAGNAALDTLTHLRVGSFPAYAFPPDQAVGVPVTWSQGEWPSPIGGDPMDFTEEVARRYGYPITLTFDSADVREVEVVLRAVGGEPLELHVSSPEAPAQQGSHRANMNSIFLMSKRPLAEKTTYEVRIRCLHASRPFEKRWTFTTG